MRAGDRQAGFQAHEFGQHFGAANHGNVARARGQHLDIVLCNRRRHGDDTRTGNIFLAMTDHYRHTHIRQPARIGILAQITALHLIAHDMHHLGNTAHANAANADNVPRPKDAMCAAVRQGFASLLFSLPAELSLLMSDSA